MDLTILREQYKKQGIPVLLDESLAFLIEILKNKNPKNILEIGCACGTTSIEMLQACENAKITVMEKDRNMLDYAVANFSMFNVSERVTVISGDALIKIREISEKFDFIFLDGPKGQYKNFLPYIKNLLNIGGVLVCDNVLFRGYVNSEREVPKKYKTLVQNLRIFNKLLAEDTDFETRIYETGDGVSVSKKM